MRDAWDVVCPETGKVRVLNRMCYTCIFRPDAKMTLTPERFAEVEETNVARGALLTCHDTLPYGRAPEFGPAVCFGFWARHGTYVAAGRIALLIGIIRIDPPEPSGKEEPG